jgi:NAD+-dependent protein deacetylase sirtuin 5
MDHNIARCLKASPNAAHKALASLHADPATRAKILPGLKDASRSPLFITQNIDNISPTLLLSFRDSDIINEEQLGESKERLIEMHGNIFKQQCTQCKHISTSTDTDLAWEGGSLNPGSDGAEVKEETLTKEQLPRCGGPSWNGSNRYGRCGGLLRPSVIWFGEIPEGLGDIGRYLNWTDMLIVVGTSALVYPAAGFSKTVKDRGGKVAIFNLDASPADDTADWMFQGRCEQELPRVLGFGVRICDLKSRIRKADNVMKDLKDVE